MKIRAGFVTNSSSTSFLIIAKEEFSVESLLKLMGIREDSPLIDISEQLYEDIMSNVDVKVEMSTVAAEADIEGLFRQGRRDLSPHMIDRLRAMKGKRVTAYFGRLSSESNPIETFFCTDSFEEENDQLYIDGLECAW
jgi:hypothetical protein